MIVFQILYSLDIGGIEEFASNMSAYLSHDNIHNFIILLSAGRDSQWCDNKKQKILAQGTKLVDFGNLSKFNKHKQLTALINKIKPNIVIMHHELNTLRIAPTVKKREVKFIQIQHSTKINGISAHRFFAKLLVHKYVAVSNDVRSSLAAGIHMKESKIQVIENGIVSDNYCDSKTSDKTVRILAAGRFTEQKNFIELAYILKKILILDDMENVEITIAGCGETYDKVDEIIGNDSRVNLPGAVSDMKSLYAESDIYISFSLYEGFSLTLLEAMASRCAVLATATSGTNSIIKSERNGVLVDVRDSDSFLNELNILIKDASKRKTLADAAVESAKFYDFSITYKKYKQLMNTLLKQG